MSELALQLIEREKQNPTGVLDLGNCGLTEIPDGVFDLTHLRELSMSNTYWEYKENTVISNQNRWKENNLSRISKKIKNLSQLKVLRLGDWNASWEIKDIQHLQNLKNLQELYLPNNQIDGIQSLQNLKNLQHLDLSANDISDIRHLRKLENLQYLDLSNNQINDIQSLQNLKKLKNLTLINNQINNIQYLQNLENLQYLDLRNNQINDIQYLQNLENLKKINLDVNNINDIQHLKNLKNLQYLDLSNNQINGIPHFQNLKNLRYLDLSNNQINDIQGLQKSENLQKLNLRNNQINNIQSLKKLTNLHELNLRNNRINDIRPLLSLLKKELAVSETKYFMSIHLDENPLTSPPLEIIEQGKKAVIRYFEEIEKSGSRPLLEARLLIVGQGGAGKTSLRRKLISPDADMPAPGDTTRGIEIDSLTLTNQADTTFDLNIWDFGGQNIQHYAHQFFLTGSSLYALVHNQREQNTNFQYWLNIIEMLGRSSPVVIVQNEVNGHLEPIQEAASIRDRFLNVLHPFYSTDIAQAATDKRFDQLKKAIIEYASDKDLLPHFGQSYPNSFFRVRAELQKKSVDHHFITKGEFDAICSEDVTDINLVNDYLATMTILGNCLHFPDDLELHDYIFLHPKWIIDALFLLLYHPSVIEQKGEFDERDTLKIWEGSEYDSMRGKLIRLMENFELCYKIENHPDKKYIVPQRLSDIGENDPWDETESIQIIYRYKFMPKGIITRLTCRLHPLIEEDRVWNKAVILSSRDSRAFIRERYAESEIWIDVAGDKKSDLLNRVIEAADQIHDESKFVNLKVEKLLPCHCSQCATSDEPYLFNYDYLVELLKENESTERCQKSRIKINIRDFMARFFEHGDVPPEYIMQMQKMLEDGFRKTHERLDRNWSILDRIENGLTSAQRKELNNLENKIFDAQLRDDQIQSMLSQILQSAQQLEKQLPADQAKYWHQLKSQLNKGANPKHKLKLALSLLFVKYEIEYDAVKLFQKIRQDIREGNWFVYGDDKDN